MSVTVNYTSKCMATEILETNMPAAGDKTVQHNGYDAVAAVSGASSPPVTKCAYFEKALAAGVGTIDLTALVGSNGAAVDGSGLRVQFLKVRNKSTNTHTLTIGKGAANGYDGFGAAFSLELGAGAEALVRTLDNGSNISGTNKNLDLAGTGTDVLEVALVLG